MTPDRRHLPPPAALVGFAWDGEDPAGATHGGDPLPLPHRCSWMSPRIRSGEVPPHRPWDLTAWELWVPCGENGAYLYLAFVDDEDSTSADLHVGEDWRREDVVEAGSLGEDREGAFDPLANEVVVLPENKVGWLVHSRLGVWRLDDLDDPLGRLRALARWIGDAPLVEATRPRILDLERLLRAHAFDGTPCGRPGLEGDLVGGP